MIDGEPEIDPHSETWRAVKRHAQKAIAAHERVCKTPGTPMTDTENARGALLALEGLLKLGGESNIPSGS